MESIKNRTSIRKYAEKEVSEELLNRLLEEAERTGACCFMELLGLHPVLKPHVKVQYLIIYRGSVPFQNPIFAAKLVKVSQKVVFLSLF